ncbi:cell division protein FtsA [Candidatus Saccharibacteria bacterium]|nr:cell division protein FtsA [Candidatus Saccharibacteria bacterium]
MNSSLPYFVGLDIGTSAVRCVIGVLPDGESVPSVIGFGSAVNRGMRKSTISHIDDVVEAISQAIGEAEKIAGVTVDRATANLGGAHIEGVNSRGVIAISTSSHEITIEDRERVESAATIIQMPPNRDIIQVFAKSYRLDGQESIKDPVGMHGVRLEVDTHIVTASTPAIRSMDSALERARVLSPSYTTSGLADAEAVLTRSQKESGTAIIDIGAGSTSMVVMEDGEVQHVAVIPIGGINMTNDLAIGLRTDLEIAEAVKVQFGDLKTTKSKKMIKVRHDGRDHEFELSDVQMILSARAEELFEFVDKELKKINKSKKLPGGVVLTGGVASLPGLSEFAKEELELPSRVGKLLEIGGIADKLGDQHYTTAVGLMWLDMLIGQHNDSANTGAKGIGSMWSAVRGSFGSFGKK